jgi:hypothetical protein
MAGDFAIACVATQVIAFWKTTQQSHNSLLCKGFGQKCGKGCRALSCCETHDSPVGIRTPHFRPGESALSCVADARINRLPGGSDKTQTLVTAWFDMVNC